MSFFETGECSVGIGGAAGQIREPVRLRALTSYGRGTHLVDDDLRHARSDRRGLLPVTPLLHFLNKTRGSAGREDGIVSGSGLLAHAAYWFAPWPEIVGNHRRSFKDSNKDEAWRADLGLC